MPRGRSLEAVLVKFGSESSETPAPDEADGAARQIQLPGDVAVRPGRRLEEQGMDQLAATRRERGHRVAERLFAFDLEQNLFGQLGRVREIVERVGSARRWVPGGEL